MAEQQKKLGIVGRSAKWLRELKSELKKIIWPGRKQVVNNTIIVLVMSLIVSVLVFLLDSVFVLVRDLIISLV